MPAIHGVVRWRLKDLTLWIWEEFRISISETTLSRELRALGYRKLSARPRHYLQNPPKALELFKKVSPATLRRRSGQASQTAPRSSCGGRTRPGSARRTRSPGAGPDGAPGPAPRMISGRVQSPSSEQSAPQQGKGAALVLPRCDTQAMSLHLAEVAQAVAPGAHGVMLMDRWGSRSTLGRSLRFK